MHCRLRETVQHRRQQGDGRPSFVRNEQWERTALVVSAARCGGAAPAVFGHYVSSENTLMLHLYDAVLRYLSSALRSAVISSTCLTFFLMVTAPSPGLIQMNVNLLGHLCVVIRILQNVQERYRLVDLSFLEPVLTEQWNLLSRRHLAAHEAASPWPDPVREAKPARRDGSASPGAAALPSLASAQPGSAREWQAGKKRRARPVPSPPPPPPLPLSVCFRKDYDGRTGATGSFYTLI